MKPSKEQRRNPRFECNGYAEVHLPEDSTKYRARIANLSLEGCQLELTVPVTFQEDIVDLLFTVNGLPFFVRGRIQNIRRETTLGIHFLQLSSRARGQLVDLLIELEEDSLKARQSTKIAS